jgi:acyl transferase domain-containing protein/acyl-CoA synthetase (AMP-forming)/AMP-acid ligase II/thioesterase domain-containing protein
MSDEVQDRVLRLTGSLLARGLQPGDRVGIILPSAADSVVAFTAALRSGGVPVPLFMGSALSEIGAAIRECAPAVVMTSTSVADQAPSLFESARLKVVVGEDGSYRPGWVDLITLEREGEPLDVVIARRPSDPAMICYTSGTSGRPKGVVYTHGSVIAAHRGPARSGDGTVVTALPLNTFGGWALTGRLVFRWTLVLLGSFEPRAFLHAVETHRAHTLALVPSMCEALVALPEDERFDLSSLRRVTITGAHVSPFLVERLTRVLGVVPSVGYGMTEVGGGIAGTSISSKKGSVGRLVPGTEIRILGADGLQLSHGDVGEICVKTPWMAQGYVGEPGDAATVFEDGWVRTGDIGYLDAQRELFVLGRQKDIIIQGGMNVHPAEVVEVITQVPGVRECAVVGMPHELLGEEIVGIVVADDVTLTDGLIIERCRVSMDARKVPVRVRFWEAIPRTGAGKVDKEAIRSRLRTEWTPNASPELSARLRLSAPPLRRVLARETIERALRRVLGESTRIPQTEALDPRTPLGEFGVDSLGAARLTHALTEALGQRVSPVLAFSHPTIDQLAAAIVEQCAGPEDRPTVRPFTDHAPLLREPIAIIGIGCRVPGGGDTPARFWAMLRDGVDSTAEIRRWDVGRSHGSASGRSDNVYVRHAAMLDTAHMFDAEFFGLTDSEAGALDPQHRLAMEVAWEAIEDAGYNPFAVSAAGLFLGISGSGDVNRSGLGEAPSMAVGRICNFLDLRGPALAIDTACSSSLVAVHAAVRSLREGECDVAIAGGVHIIRSLKSFASLCELGVLARDGRCKAFDVSADGYGRGEGAVMIVLKRLSDAQAEGCRIMAVISGSAVRHDGRSSSLTAPNGIAQRDVIAAALMDARVAPEQIDYLEAHGAGTALGDPIELEAAVAALRHPARALLVGSVKSNIGHLEAAAGAAGLAKVALALQSNAIPAHLHFRSLNPLLEPLEKSFKIPTSLTPWPPEPGRRRIAGVTSMGLSGTNAHVVVEEAPALVSAAADDGDAGNGGSPRLLCISARDAVALRHQARRYADCLAASAPEDFGSLCFTAAAGRNHFRYRATVLARSPKEAREQLLAIAEQSADSETRDSVVPRTAFLFGGHGRHKVGMARGLYRSEPAFRAAMDRCAAIIAETAKFRLVDVLYAEPKVDWPSLESMAVAQPALFAVEWSLAVLWQSWGIEPDAVLGHSIGECVAACVAGVMSLEDGLKLAMGRGRLLESLPNTGAMAAILADEERVRRIISEHQENVSIAAINAPRNIIIAGDNNAIDEIERVFNGGGIETRRLHIPRAAHSPAVDPILDELEQLGSTITYAPSRLPIVSTVTGQWTANDELSHASYWRRHMRAPVRFASAISTLLGDGFNTFVEIGPAPVLTVLGADSVRNSGASLAWLPSLSPDNDDCEQMYNSLGELYRRGVDPAWDRVRGRAGVRRMPLPTYPFQRRAYWNGFVNGVTTTRPPTNAPGQAEATDKAFLPSTASTAVHPAVPSSPDETLRRITDQIRRQVVQTIGRHAASYPDDANLLQLGFDSIRVATMVVSLSRLLHVGLRPQDFVSNPTIASLAAYVTRLLGESQSAVRSHVLPSPLVTLNDRGTRGPVFCIHPSGGRITCYLRLRELLGDNQPLFAIQSRALDDSAREYRTIETMAIDYATLIQNIPGSERCRLIGWSMGGLIAQAVATELERRGVAVGFVGLIDPVGWWNARAEDPEQDLAFALTAIIHEGLTVPPSLDVVSSVVAESLRASDRDTALLDWCEQCKLIPARSITVKQLGSMLNLYLRHFALVREYRPKAVAASVKIWWSEGARKTDTTCFGLSRASAKTVGGTHFSIVRSPYLDEIATDIVDDFDDVTALLQKNSAIQNTIGVERLR